MLEKKYFDAMEWKEFQLQNIEMRRRKKKKC